MLHQRGVLVVEHQVLEAAIQIEGLGEAEASRRAVDDAVLHLAVRPDETTPTITTVCQKLEMRHPEGAWLALAP